MFVNNLKITIRRLLKDKMQSAILISGLTLGMMTCILLLQYVSYELSFDDFHQEQTNIYRVINERFQNGSSIQKGAITYPTIGPRMKAEFPEVKLATRIAYSSSVTISQGDKISPLEPGLWVDEHFFGVFDFPFLARQGLDLFKAPNEIVLTRALADRYFPNAKGNYDLILDEELLVDRYEQPFKIVGICEDVPENSHLKFDLLLSYASCIRYWGEGADNSWTWSDFYHYLLLEPGTNVRDLEVKFADFSEKHFRGTEVSGSEEVFTLQALSDIHLNSQNLEYEIVNTGNGRAIWSLLIIAFFILFIAWINYVNLSSVRTIERSKEVGVRKVIGATKGQLILQFLSEALIVNLISLILAIVLAEAAIPWFASKFAMEAQSLSLMELAHFQPVLAISLLSLIIAGILASGVYPALLLSSTKMSAVLKGIFSKNIGNAWLRKSLVVFQFTISVGLIILTWMVSQQIRFMSQKDLGLNIDQVMMLNAPEMSGWDSTFIDRMNTLKTEFKNIPGVEEATSSSRIPGQRMARLFDIRRISEGDGAQTFSGNVLHVDFDYTKTYGLELLAGRFFRRGDHNTNFNQVDKVILNESAVEMLGFQDVDEAIHAPLSINDRQWEIVGVLPDFHQQSLHHGIEPIFFFPLYSTYNAISLKLSGSQNLDKTIAAIQATYKKIFPGNIFQYQFVDDRFQNLYESEVRFAHILSFFTLLTLLIACLGLFGLTSYITFLRTKEIGIRKVLGANPLGIIALLSKDFLRLVFIAILIAVPLAYYLLNNWLADFAYRISISWWVFVLAGILALLLAFLTIGFQSIKVALTNPSKSLRNE